MILERVCVGPMQVNCYILADKVGGEAIIIDPGAQTRLIQKVLDKHKFKPAFVVNTHGHYDHIGSDDAFGVPVYIHSADAACLKEPKLNLSFFFGVPSEVKSEVRILEEDQILKLEGIELKVLHLPGHTAGGIGLLLQEPDEHMVFTGDSLFYLSIGRTDLAGGSESLLLKVIKEKLLNLPDDTKVYPGHGPSSTIGEEKKNNPFLM